MSEAKTYAYHEGKFVLIEDANINIMTHGFLYGTSIFEGIRGYWSEKHEEIYLFRMKEHYERLLENSKLMHLDCKYSLDELSRITVELVRRNAPRTDTYVRPTLYKAARRIGPGLQDNPSEFSMFTVPFGDYFKGAKGLKVCVSNWRRIADNVIPARGKIAGAYCNTALAKSDAVYAGFDDAIMLTQSGSVSEGSAMNLFLVKGGRLITSRSTDSILPGITRATIMEFAKAEFGVSTEVRSIDRSELYVADELFFCGTGAQVAPVIEVDRRATGNGDEGPLTRKIREYYISMCRGENQKYKHWLTPVYAFESKTVGAGA